MSAESFVPSPVTAFGGWMPNAEPESLPEGMSWDCLNVELVPGGVGTRPGLVSQFPALANGALVNYMRTYVTQASMDRLLVLDSLGNLYKENPTGTLATIYSALKAGLFGKSDTQFGREYLAFSDGIKGLDLPRQFDDTNFDRVSQVGPGLGPTAGDASVAIGSISRNSNVVTLLAASPINFQVGQTIVVAGVTGCATSFNGSFTVLTVTPNGQEATYAQTGDNCVGGTAGATVGIQGSIAPGAHQVAVSFITRQGYWTRPSPPVTWTSSGDAVLLTNIPIGPANVVARLIMFTAAGQIGAPSFYTIPPPLTPSSSPTGMIIYDNTSTSATFDFSDTELLAGTSVGYLFNLIELPEEAGVIAYGSRLFWWGERTGAWGGANGAWLNLTFDGGWNPAPVGSHPANTIPNGWTPDATYGAGGSRERVNVAWLDAYRITGDGATAIRGKITQGAVKDYNGVQLISANQIYNVRARVMAGGGLAQGTLHVNVYSPSFGFTSAGLAVSAAQAPTTALQEFTAALTPAFTSGQTPPVVPSDLVLQIYADGTPTNGGWFVVENVEIYQASLGELAPTVVRASRINDPESYDGVQGLMQVGPSDGQRVTNAFIIRNNLYIVKERSLWVTTDDGVNEPALWSVSQVSNQVGTPSIRGVAYGDQAVAIAGFDGVYVFDGSPPEKLSHEIHEDQRGLATGTGPVWDQVNFYWGQTIWIAVQPDLKRLLVGVPIGAVTQPNYVLALQFSWGTEAMAHASRWYLFKDAPLARGWAPWKLGANCAALVFRPVGAGAAFAYELFLGSNDASGNVYELTEGAYTDNGAVIPAYYSTYFISGSELAGMPPVSRNLYGYLRVAAEGSGPLVLAGLPIAERVAAISSVSRAGNVATATTATPHFLNGPIGGQGVGDAIEISNVSDSTFNGTYNVLAVLSPTQFTYQNVGANTGSIAQTAPAAGAAQTCAAVLPILGVATLGRPAGIANDLEWPINLSAERMSLRLEIHPTSPAGSWFRVRQRAVVHLKPDPWAPVGTN